jgi:hypothetical protein
MAIKMYDQEMPPLFGESRDLEAGRTNRWFLV